MSAVDAMELQLADLPRQVRYALQSCRIGVETEQRPRQQMANVGEEESARVRARTAAAAASDEGLLPSSATSSSWSTRSSRSPRQETRPARVRMQSLSCPDGRSGVHSRGAGIGVS